MRLTCLLSIAAIALSLGLVGCQTCPNTQSCGIVAGSGFDTGAPLAGLATLKPGRTMRASSSDPNWRTGNGDCRHIKPGETFVIADLEGPGVINHIWNTIAPGERGYSKLYVIRMYWDGEAQPSVEAPIGDFFVVGHGMDRSMNSLPVRVTSEGRARNCYWPMPFRKSARITVTNEGREPLQALFWYVDWQQLPELPENAPYFHAMYRQEYPTVMGQNYQIADIEGRGHYVGTVMNIRQHWPGWYGEGDDFFFIDGEEEPSLCGTGSEDYFCDAWGFREFDGLFYGVPVFDHFEALGKITAYRWHIQDPVTFKKSLRVEIEHKGAEYDEEGNYISGFGEREDDFASVAYWYQLEPHKPFPQMAPAYDRLYVDWSNLIEAESLIDSATATAGAITTQDGGYSGGKQLFWQPQAPDQTLTLPVTLDKAGEYEIIVVATQSWDYGIYQVMLDGEPLGAPIDLQSDNITTGEYHFDVGRLDAGAHTVSFVNKGANPKSEMKGTGQTGYYLGLDGVLFAPKK